MLSVIVVHSLSILVPEDGGPAGALLSVFHSSREVFLLLSALVLTYTAGSGPVDAGRFWRRRFPLIAAPYVAWSVIYLLTDGDLRSPGYALSRLGFDLLTGHARYHLYFVLLTFQLYLVFPWLLRWVRAREGRLLRLGAASLALQVAFTAVTRWHLDVPPPLSWLSAHPGSWLASYQLYVIAGIAAGLHIHEVTQWCSRHVRALAVLAGAVVGASLAWYGVDVRVLGTNPVQASDVFQPAVVFESLALAALELGACERWTARARPAAMRVIGTGSDLSFGIYLLHPMLLELAIHLGVAAALAGLAPVAAVAAVVLVVAPALLAAAAAATALLRRTPASVMLTGRRRRAQRGASLPALPRTVASLTRATAVRAGAAVAVVSVVAAAALWTVSQRRSGATTLSAEKAAASRPVAGRVGLANSSRTGAEVSWVSETVAMTYDGAPRSYLVFFPRAASGPLPLIVDLSGSAISAAGDAQRMDWPAVTTAAVVVFPADTGTGTGATWNAGHCCGSAAASHVDDVGFVEAVTARVLATVPVADRSRVFLAGYSNGGKLALELACDDPARWNGVAVYGATATSACPSRPAVSLQVSASSGDPELTIGPAGTPHTVDGFVEPTITAEVASARAAAQCDQTGSLTSSGTLQTTTWSCAAGRRVALALYAGGSHSWPETVGATPGETSLMWRWFVALGA